MKKKHNTLLKTRAKAVTNIFLVYLLTSAVTGRYKIFSVICASFPFILPIIFGQDGVGSGEKIIRSFLYGWLGIFVSASFMALTDTYKTTLWLVPSLYGFIMCVGFSLAEKELSKHKRAVLKCIISVFVCLLAFA